MINFSRRSFIENLSVTAVAAVTVSSVTNVFGQKGNVGLNLGPTSNNSGHLDHLTSGRFEPYLNTTFTVQNGPIRSSSLILREIRVLNNKTNEKRGYSGESFSLLFQGPSEANLASGPYRFGHDSMGRFSFLVNPVGAGQTNYEVIVNRLHR
jgi:hypothetical protein